MSENIDNIKESDWARLFAAHFAKKLSCSELAIISDTCYSGSHDCICGCGEKMIVGDTSMGNKKVWHGSVDILLGNVAVAFSPKQENDDDTKGSAFELKTENIKQHRDQITAETIVFGCIQRSDTLAPLIAVSLEDFKVFLYDFDSDILFESESLN